MTAVHENCPITCNACPQPTSMGGPQQPGSIGQSEDSNSDDSDDSDPMIYVGVIGGTLVVIVIAVAIVYMFVVRGKNDTPGTATETTFNASWSEPSLGGGLQSASTGSTYGGVQALGSGNDDVELKASYGELSGFGGEGAGYADISPDNGEEGFGYLDVAPDNTESEM